MPCASGVDTSHSFVGQTGALAFCASEESGDPATKRAQRLNVVVKIDRFQRDIAAANDGSVACKTNRLGVKGCGEAGCAGALPSVMNAIVDALGVRHIDMPVTPEKVWHVLNERR
jgi:hypothetical protein